MTGFFKKLFNRVTGKGQETPPPPQEIEALPIEAAVEQMPAEESRVPDVQEQIILPPKPPPAALPDVVEVVPKKPRAKAKAPAKKPPVKKPSNRKPVAKKTAPVPEPEPEIVPEPVPDIEATILAEPQVAFTPEPPPPAQTPGVETLARPAGWFSRLSQGLSKSSRTITSSVTSIFTKRKLNQETLQELEDVLIQADLGVAVSERIIVAVSAGRYDKEIEPDEVKRILASEVAKVLKPVEVPFNFGSEKPFVILVVGVNGAGKTTTIGKLGAIAASEGFKIMFAACDTFRAAAIEQLTIWGDRIGARTLSRPTGADSSGLAFDAMREATSTGMDILFIDTAGRLQNKAYLMDELDKIVRVIRKQDAAAPHAVILVLDATTGQNAISQADIFTQVAGVTGLIMTKLDGTARGGILVAIADRFKLPIHAIGVGETIDDLQPFDADAFARAISGLNET